MARRKTVRMVAFVLLIPAVFELLLSYWLSAQRARTPRIITGPDRSDIQTRAGSQAMSSYDPYFNRVNVTRGVVASGTNVVLVINTPKR
jgi:hypothetical protein